MRKFWNASIGVLTPGIRLLLLGITALFLTAEAGVLTRSFNLYAWLALFPSAFWSGQVWQLVTFAFLPGGMLDFLLNGLALAMLGVWLERVWSRYQLWVHCLVVALAAGVVLAAVSPSSPVGFCGLPPLVVGLLPAWAIFFGHERVRFMGIWEMSLRTAAIVFAVVEFLLVLRSNGIIALAAVMGSGLAGWGFVKLRMKIVSARAGRVVECQRIGRLEM